MKSLQLYVDGASKGNPGHAGVGVVVSSGDQVLKNICAYIGETTNNVAEYTALIYALEEALVMKAESITVYSDSQLLCRQLAGEYKVKHENIKPLYERATRLTGGFKHVLIKNIPREENKGADKLANQAVKDAVTRLKK